MHNQLSKRGGLARSLRAGLLLALVGGGMAAQAQQVLQAQYLVHEPARPMAEALLSIARQTGVSVTFDPAGVAGRTTQAVSGRLSAHEAISRAVQGSGLVAEATAKGVVVVRPAAGPPPGGGQPTAPAASRPAAAGAYGTPDGRPLWLVQAQASAGAQGGQAGASGTAGGAGEADAQGAQAAQAAQPAQLAQRVEVTGSRLRRIDSETSLPVNVYTREQIDRSGQPTLERFLAGLPEVSISPGEGGLATSTLGQGTVQLRGLPIGSTLVLVNGRRVQAVGSSSANMFNLSLIPLAAVERVEVVPVGSSAVYGGDALAGVVNIILKKSVPGQALDLRLGTARGIGDGSLSLAFGGSDEQGSFMVLGSYHQTTPLTMAERAFFVDADYRRFGGPDVRSRSCTPGTVVSADGANLPGLGAPLAAIPAHSGGSPLTIADFVPTAGQDHLCNPNASLRGRALVHGTETYGVHALGERRVGGELWAFAELTHAQNRLRAQESGLALANQLVGANNPYNPFGVPVRVTARLGEENGLQTFSRDTDYTRALLGLRGPLWAGWDFEATAATSRDTSERRIRLVAVDAVARNAALAASDPAVALNPFTTGRAASDEVLRGIWSDGLHRGVGRKDAVSATARGALFTLPAGPVEASVGLEYARDQFQTLIPGSANYDIRRSAGAAFGELVAPLLRQRGPVGGPASGSASAQGWSLATLTLAARRDSYADFGSAATYQAGLELRPARTLLLRAAAASSFKPPTLLQTHVQESTTTSETLALVDPARGNEPILGATVLRNNNPALNPEKGRAYSLGAYWEPAAGSRFGLGAWQIRIDGLISVVLPQVVLNHEALFPAFVRREPAAQGQPGRVTELAYSEVNFGGVQTAGFDVEASHAWASALGRWRLGASAARTLKYDVAMTPGAPMEARLGRRYLDFWAPQWKGRLSAGLDRGGWGVGLTSRYLGAYKDAGTSERALGDYWVHDLSAHLDLKKTGLSLGSLRAASLSLAVANLADKQPQFAATAPYYDLTQADWRGRYGSVRLSVNW